MIFVLKILVTFILSYFFYFGANGQIYSDEKFLDSLTLLIIHGSDDTNKIDHLNTLSRAYMYQNSDTAIFLGNEALILAKKLNWEKGILVTYSKLGVYYRLKGDYPNSLRCYEAALSLYREKNNKKGVATILGNLGNVFKVQANYPKALEYYFKALQMDEELDNKHGVAKHLGNIGVVYVDQKDFDKALDYYSRALKLGEELGIQNYVATWYGNMGIIYEQSNEPTKALEYYMKGMKIDEEINNKFGVFRHLTNIGNLYGSLKDYPKALDYFFQSLKRAEDLRNVNYVAICYGNIGSLYTLQGKFKEAEKYLKKTIAIEDSIGAIREVMQFSSALSDLYDTLGYVDFENNNFKNAAAAYRLALTHYKKSVRLKDSIYSDENKKQLIEKEMSYEFEKKEIASKAAQDIKDAIAQSEDRKKNLIIGLSIGVIILVLVLLGFVIKERRKSEKLLLNILPEETARELKKSNYVAPRKYEMVSVLFTDFVGFSEIAEKLQPEELILELNECFSYIDSILKKHNVEKIKTIGDSYMCAGGLPVPNISNPIDIVKTALEIQSFMATYKAKRLAEKRVYFECRLGVHTGPVVAGVIGTVKFAYDIWGDTVNIASRMESSGLPGKVNISGGTYELVKDCFICTSRGEIEVKNKGKIKMYFVEKLNG